jgi:hypothetical protein
MDRSKVVICEGMIAWMEQFNHLKHGVGGWKWPRGSQHLFFAWLMD